jgi:hypothetical protein
MPQPAPPKGAKVYKNRDFDDEAVEKLHQRLSSGLLEAYWSQYDKRAGVSPIVENPLLVSDGPVL